MFYVFHRIEIFEDTIKRLEEITSLALPPPFLEVVGQLVEDFFYGFPKANIKPIRPFERGFFRPNFLMKILA